MDEHGRERLILLRARKAAATAFAVLSVAVVLVVASRPADPISITLLLATLALAGAGGIAYLVDRRLGERRSVREAGQTRILQGLSRSGSPEAIVESIIDEIRAAADVDHIVIARLRPVHRVVETTLVSNRAVVPAARSILPASVLDANRAADGRSTIRAGREARTPQEVADDLARELSSSYALANTIAEPLAVDERIVGAVILSRRQQGAWSETDRQLLAWSARELSAALARAFAYEEAEISANVDSLTGLPNRRYLEALLATVGPRRRFADRLGALMIDLDHFKKLNDRYGHATGDRVLRAVADRIFDSIRADDTPARYGGEEFAVILRRATPAQAIDVAERIRRHIGAIPPDELGIEGRVTVSIGVAVADSREADAHALLADADDALYQAKREGRDRVVLKK